jgi:hypothetical protein
MVSRSVGREIDIIKKNQPHGFENFWQVKRISLDSRYKYEWKREMCVETDALPTSKR